LQIPLRKTVGSSDLIPTGPQSIAVWVVIKALQNVLPHFTHNKLGVVRLQQVLEEEVAPMGAVAINCPDLDYSSSAAVMYVLVVQI
jgi:hypothetical protein